MSDEHGDVTIIAYDAEGNTLAATGWPEAHERVMAELADRTANEAWVRDKATQVLDALLGGGWR